VVLAAGTSSRLGRPKQLLDLGGRPVLRHVVEAALASPLDRVVVVLGHREGEVAAALPRDPRLRIVSNPQYRRGQSTSLRAGLRAAGEAGAAVILLGDQPGVRAEAIEAVVRAWREGAGAVVQASYSGRAAHPTLLDRSVWEEVGEEAGDQGARDVLARHPEWRALVEVGGDPPPDIDTERDYEQVSRAYRNPT
jgi:molybdenum cofactor cytidylyltransferase